jgi:uncharacterized membrane protein
MFTFGGLPMDRIIGTRCIVFVVLGTREKETKQTATLKAAAGEEEGASKSKMVGRIRNMGKKKVGDIKIAREKEIEEEKKRASNFEKWSMRMVNQKRHVC